jgi:hypothetical protein
MARFVAAIFFSLCAFALVSPVHAGITNTTYDFTYTGDQFTLDVQMLVENSADGNGGHVVESASGTFSGSLPVLGVVSGSLTGLLPLGYDCSGNCQPIDNLLYLNSPYVDQFGIGFAGAPLPISFVVFAPPIAVDPMRVEIFDLNLLDPGSFAPTVPEPSTWAMMILGFAGIGAMTYRRRKSAMLAA